MNNPYSSSLTQPEDTLGAIEKLKSRGIWFRSRGLHVLGAAGAAALMAIGAILLYMNAQPMSTFSTIDLPTLSESVASLNAGPDGALDAQFDAVFDSLRGVLTGAIPKFLAIVTLLISGIAGVAGGRILTAIHGLIFATMMMFLPAVLDIVAPSSETGARQANGNNSVLLQLANDKRYKELSVAVSERMPSAQAAYVKAQIAYLSKDAQSLREELNRLGGSNLDKWSPNWERLYVLETEAYGTPQIKGTVAFADDARSSSDTRMKALSFCTAIATINGLIGGALFVFGIMLIRRARRLEAMLRLDQEKDAAQPLAREDVPGQPLELEITESCEEVTAWQPAGQNFTCDPVANSEPTEQPSLPMMDGVLIGAAAGLVTSIVPDDDQPCRDALDTGLIYCTTSDSSSVGGW